jgi:hypothetical protein
VTLFTSPRTWAPGGLTSAALNTDIRDNENYLYEVIHGTNADKIPFAAHDNNAWIVPQCRVALRTAWVLLNSTDTLLNFNAADIWDTDTIHDTTTNNTRLRPATKGIYVCTAQMNFAGNATGTRRVQILLNSATLIANTEISAVGAGQTALTALAVWQFNGSTDYIEMQVFQNSGGSLTSPNIGNYSTEFGVTWVGSF